METRENGNSGSSRSHGDGTDRSSPERTVLTASDVQEVIRALTVRIRRLEDEPIVHFSTEDLQVMEERLSVLDALISTIEYLEYLYPGIMSPRLEDSERARQLLSGLSGARLISHLEAFTQEAEAEGQDGPATDAALNRFSRTILKEGSSLFRNVTLHAGGTVFEAVSAEFDISSVHASSEKTTSSHEIIIDDALLVHGVTYVDSLARDSASKIILYMERGEDATFYDMALSAQNQGAAALVILNNVAKPWPVVMRAPPSTESVSGSGNAVRIPVVMLKQSDSQEVLSLVSSSKEPPVTTLSIRLSHPSNQDCSICHEPYDVNQSVLQLVPGCSHVFHEGCIVPWLQNSNTCPMCRHELVLDGEESKEHSSEFVYR